MIFDVSYTCIRVQARLLCPCAIGAIFIMLSYPNCLNVPEGRINIALRLGHYALVKSNLTLKYANIYFIFYCSEMWHYCVLILAVLLPVKQVKLLLLVARTTMKSQ